MSSAFKPPLPEFVKPQKTPENLSKREEDLDIDNSREAALARIKALEDAAKMD